MKQVLENYNYIMARFDRDPALVFQTYFYDESPQSQRINVNGKVGIAIGINSDYSRQRAEVDGWDNVTESVKSAKPESEAVLEEAVEEAESITGAKPSIKIVAEKPKQRSRTRKK